MKCNVGGIDRTARIVVGVVLLLVGFFAPLSPVWQTVVFVIAAIALVTAIIGFCPANAIIGINTCKPSRSEGAPRT